MAPAILTFAIVFILLSGVGYLLIYRRSMSRRLARAVAEPLPIDFLLAPPPPRPGAKVARFVEPFQRMMPRSSQEVSVVQKRLIRAGYREKTYINIFYGAKVLVPIQIGRASCRERV